MIDDLKMCHNNTTIGQYSEILGVIGSNASGHIWISGSQAASAGWFLYTVSELNSVAE